MLKKVIEKHSRGILKEFYSRLMRMVVFSAPGSVILTTQGMHPTFPTFLPFF